MGPDVHIVRYIIGLIGPIQACRQNITWTSWAHTIHMFGSCCHLLWAITSELAVAQAPSYWPRRVYCQIHNRLNWADASWSGEYTSGHHGPIQASWQNTHMAIIGPRETYVRQQSSPVAGHYKLTGSCTSSSLSAQTCILSDT